MNSHEELEKVIQKNEMAIQELAIRIETVDRHVQELLSELQVSPEQLTGFVEKRENFTEDNWSTMNQHKQELEEKLQRELANIRNPLKTKKAFAERKVERHWLFVR